MKRRLLLLLLICGLATTVCVNHPVSAHVLKSNGAIGAVLHIEPDDNPTSGVKIFYTLSFRDTSNRLALSDCGCTVIFKESNRLMGYTSLSPTSELVSKNSYTFSASGVYTMEVTGTPRKNGAFQPFSLTYLIRVQSPSGSASMQPFPVTLAIGFGLLVALLILASYRLM